MEAGSSSFHALEQEELTYAATGEVRSARTHDYAHRATFLRSIRSDYRASEALACMDRHSPLPLARALLARGKLAEAGRALAEAESVDGTAEERAERLLQRIRLDALAGRWNEVLTGCGRFADVPEVSMLSRSAAFQIRANAWMEIGDYVRAGADLERLDAFASLLPHGPIAFYGRAARVKLLARTGGGDDAREAFSRLLAEWRSRIDHANLDECFTLARVALDLARIRGRPHAKLALACVNLAKALGDEAYAGLAYLDLWASLPAKERAKPLAALEPYFDSQPRVRQLFEEAKSDAPRVFDTSLRLRDALARNAEREPSLDPRVCGARIEKIYGFRSDFLADLPKRTIAATNLQPRVRDVLASLRGGEIEKERLVREVWKIARYVPARHDPLVRTAIMRLREQTGLEVLSRNGCVSLPETTLVLDL